MTRYQYTRRGRVAKPAYWVKCRGVVIGECWREKGGLSWGSPHPWFARIYSDPLVFGKGRTRDAAVEHCYDQVGGHD